MVIKLSTRAPKPRPNVHGVDPNPVRTRVLSPRPDRKSDRKESGRLWNFNLWLEWKRNKFQLVVTNFNLLSVWLNRRTETKTLWDQIIYLKYFFQRGPEPEPSKIPIPEQRSSGWPEPGWNTLIRVGEYFRPLVWIDIRIREIRKNIQIERYGNEMNRGKKSNWPANES